MRIRDWKFHLKISEPFFVIHLWKARARRRKLLQNSENIFIKCNSFFTWFVWTEHETAANATFQHHFTVNRLENHFGLRISLFKWHQIQWNVMEKYHILRPLRLLRFHFRQKFTMHKSITRWFSFPEMCVFLHEVGFCVKVSGKTTWNKDGNAAMKTNWAKSITDFLLKFTQSGCVLCGNILIIYSL